MADPGAAPWSATAPIAAELGRLAQRVGVSDSVVFAGPVPWEELPAYYDAGDVFAMPCRTRRKGLDVEGLGIVYLEASAAGLPVIGGDSGGAPDAILDGETGHVVPGKDVDAVADALIELLGDPAAATAMGRKGLAWVDREWRWTSQPRGSSTSWAADGPMGVSGGRLFRFATRGFCCRARRCRAEGSPIHNGTFGSLSMAAGWPLASVKSEARTRKRRIDSALETALLASSTATWISATSSGSGAVSAAVRAFRAVAVASRCSSASGSRVIRHAMYGRPSPTTRPWLTSGCARSRPSQHGGSDVLAARGDDQLLLPAR